MGHPETKFIQSIHRKLQPVKAREPFYYIKLQVSGNNGVPDCWYSGEAGDLWVEYKWVPERDFPVRDSSSINVSLSGNQIEWLRKRHIEGRNVCCIVGSPKGHVVLQYPIPEKISVAYFMSSAVDTQAVVDYILGITAMR